MTAIYKIKNLFNDKIYVGSAINFQRRIGEHTGLLNRNKHHSKYLQNSWNKYGDKCFVFEIIERVDNPKELIIREQ